jgi:glycosyltransferase involved in cell wall biosynthesis
MSRSTSAGEPKLFFDVSCLDDVVGKFSGIHRLMINWLVGCIELREGKNIFGISFNGEANSPGYTLVNQKQIFQRYDKANKVSSIPDSLSEELPIDISKNDVILCLGDQWHNPPLIPVLQKLKTLKRVRVVFLVHDLIPFFFPELYWAGFADKYRSCVRSMVDLSEGLVVYSDSTMRDLVSFIPSAGEKKCVKITLGANLDDHKGYLNFNFPSLSGKKYVLCVGTLQPRKNHSLLLHAWRHLLESRPEDCPDLVLVGQPGWNSDNLIYLFTESVNLRDKVTIFTHVNDEQISGLYHNAWITVFPSLYEGWGLPIAESLAHGKMCLTSCRSSMPEVGGDLVKYFSPHDPIGLCGFIEFYLDNPKQLAEDEGRISREFIITTWKYSAGKLLEYVDAL